MQKNSRLSVSFWVYLEDIFIGISVLVDKFLNFYYYCISVSLLIYPIFCLPKCFKVAI